MVRKLGLKAKLLTTGLILLMVPLLTLGIFTYVKMDQITDLASRTSLAQSKKDMVQIVQGLYAVCEARHKAVLAHVTSGLNVAHSMLGDAGISFSDTTAKWTAVNQYTKGGAPLTLKQMNIGDTPVSPSARKTDFAFVDEVKKRTGATCTVFQRVNAQGDMLRVSTNVLKLDGQRAVGTYIPAKNPDGKPNPVVGTILKGKRFYGRAFVVNDWYITAYEPLYDGHRNIIGMLYVGVLMDEGAAIRQQILDTVIGDTGYAYVLDSKGNYLISKGGERDGENIFSAKDVNGRFFIQEICKKAVELNENQVFEYVYPWQNEGETAPKSKIAQIAYFKPWDWIIGAGAYETEVFKLSHDIESFGYAAFRTMAAIVLTVMALAVAIWLATARGICKKMQTAISRLDHTAEDVAAASDKLSGSGKAISEGAGKQAAAIEETATAMEEMATTTKMNSQNTQAAKDRIGNSKTVVDQAGQIMGDLIQAMEEISSASEQTGKIIKTIDEIAFQTNLLALNAAVEAARAGEAGAGFAVVADEVRNLAIRAADAAKNTTDLIDGTVKKIADGFSMVTRTSDGFNTVAESVTQIQEFIAEIAAASEEQAIGVEQINTNIMDMSQVVQQNAAQAEQSAAASQHMNHQSGEMKKMVHEMTVMISGG